MSTMLCSMRTGADAVEMLLTDQMTRFASQSALIVAQETRLFSAAPIGR